MSVQSARFAAPLISPAFTYPAASHVAHGAALRNRRSSTINLSGIPADATIIQAFLYCDFTSLTSVTAKQSTLCFGRERDSSGDEDECEDGDSGDSGDARTTGGPALLSRFDGSDDGGDDGGDHDEVCGCASNLKPVLGTQIGAGADACWAGGSNFAFRADVTSKVKGNGRYTVQLLPGATSSQSGISPSDPNSPSVGPYAEGASLVVVFSSSTIPNGQVLIYDSGLAGQEFVSTAGFTYDLGAVPATSTGTSIFTEIGADGQVGFDLTSSLTRKQTLLNGNLIAGPSSPASDSDWNGTDGVPLPQLWDTHSHDVTGDLIAGTNPVQVIDPFTSPGGDCIIGVANVLTVR